MDSYSLEQIDYALKNRYIYRKIKTNVSLSDFRLNATSFEN